jgi:CRP/FNR family transcriptional regulator, cyclic AMP receptor protein
MSYERTADLLHLLSEVPLFEVIPPDGLAELARLGNRRAYGAASRLMRPGDTSHSLHIILTGRVRLERSHPALVAPVTLDELGPGEIVGDLGVLDAEPHSDTVTAITQTETIELAAGALASVVLQFPEASAGLLAVLSGRLQSPSELAEKLARDGHCPRDDSPSTRQSRSS